MEALLGKGCAPDRANSTKEILQAIIPCPQAISPNLSAPPLPSFQQDCNATNSKAHQELEAAAYSEIKISVDQTTSTPASLINSCQSQLIMDRPLHFTISPSGQVTTEIAALCPPPTTCSQQAQTVNLPCYADVGIQSTQPTACSPPATAPECQANALTLKPSNPCASTVLQPALLAYGQGQPQASNACLQPAVVGQIVSCDPCKPTAQSIQVYPCCFCRAEHGIASANNPNAASAMASTAGAAPEVTASQPADSGGKKGGKKAKGGGKKNKKQKGKHNSSSLPSPAAPRGSPHINQHPRLGILRKLFKQQSRVLLTSMYKKVPVEDWSYLHRPSNGLSYLKSPLREPILNASDEESNQNAASLSPLLSPDMRHMLLGLRNSCFRPKPALRTRYLKIITESYLKRDIGDCRPQVLEPEFPA